MVIPGVGSQTHSRDPKGDVIWIMDNDPSASLKNSNAVAKKLGKT
jgi:hypothetical protein